MKNWKEWQTWICWLSGIAVTLSLGIAHGGFAQGFNSKNPVKVFQAMILSAWILLPPVWFWFEYFFLYKELSDEEKKTVSLEAYKQGADVSSKIWLALVTVLYGLYFGSPFVK
jgi:cytochrome bd-type quinol oxidase subunit 2